MSLQGATVTVVAGTTSAAVVATLAAAYQLDVLPGWNTGRWFTAKTATGFTVNFAVPAPPGGSTFDWIANIPSGAVATAITGTSAVVAAGLTSLAVVFAASLPASYQVSDPTADWNTGTWITGKTSAGFTINFAVPAPPGGGIVDYIIFGPAVGTVTLADQLEELRDLLHDPNDRMWSAVQKGNYINRAMRRRDIDTAINRSTILFTVTSGTGTYTFTQMGNGQIIDILHIFLRFGQTRVILDNPSLADLNMYYRPSVTQTGWTRGWARQGPSTIILGMTPGDAYVLELDAVVYGNPLVALTDTDPLPYPFTQPVPYYAAYLAKVNERESEEKNEFWDAYQELIGFATNGRGPQIPQPWRGR